MHIHDAAALLFQSMSRTELLDAVPGEIVIRYLGWSTHHLCHQGPVRTPNLLADHLADNEDPERRFWYYAKGYDHSTSMPGIYRIRPIVKTLLPGEKLAEPVLTATALIAHRQQTGEVILNAHAYHQVICQSPDPTRDLHLFYLTSPKVVGALSFGSSGPARTGVLPEHVWLSGMRKVG